LLAHLEADEGQYSQATLHLNEALDLSRAVGDRPLAAQVSLKLLQLYLDTNGPDAASTFAPTAKRLVLDTADPQLFALLHSRLGELDARRGDLETALRHLAVAEELLEEEPNFWIEGTVRLNQCAVELYLSDFRLALLHAERSRECASISGHRRTLLAATVNVGFLHLQVGDLCAAEHAFSQTASELAAHPPLALALFDNVCELRILQGRLREAREELEKGRKLLETQVGLQNTWQSLAQAETEIRLLLREGDVTAAEHIASSVVSLAESRNDELLAARFRVLKAAVLLGAGRLRAAAGVLTDVLPVSGQLPLVAVGELERVLGSYLVKEREQELACDCLNRSRRILTAIGSASAKLDLKVALADAMAELGNVEAVDGQRSSAKEGWERRTSRDDNGVPVLDDSVLHVPSIVAVSHLFRLADRQDLFVPEVLSLLNRVDHGRIRAKTVRVPADHAEERKETPGRGGLRDVEMSVNLPHRRGAKQSLLLRAEPTVESVRLCVAFRELIEAALVAASVSRENRLSESLWAFEPVLEEGPGVIQSALMREVVSTVSRIAPTDLPVLLTGETGTGKELLARELHRRSRAAAGPFMPFNCSAVPRDMLASQLFGYRRGAFTGAVDNFPGIIRSAANGTLFLDEIGELNLEAQPKLLRFLESSEIHPLGEPQPVRVNVRVVAATNVHLEKLMQEGRFREDLYYRLNVARIHLPPLRERREEIPALVDFYLSKYSQESRRARLRVSDEALEFLMLYRWPGNIRQLANEIRRIVAFAEPGSVVVPSMLAPEIQASRRTVDASQPVVGPNEMVIRVDQSLDAAVAQLERAMIQRALAESHGHLETAADRLGISRKGLFLKRRRLGLAN
jgi:DNA-binding NtrC family response regulator/tetratricopeptide (TPR) repeat protein